MNCTQCGTEINLNAKFCHNCGTPIQIQDSKPLSNGVRGLKEIRGWVYIISNQSMPDLLKIGYSTKDPQLRAKEFNNAGIPHPYIVEYDVLLENPYYVEQETHKRLMRNNANKEWFSCTLEEAIAAIKSVVGAAYIKENFRSKIYPEVQDDKRAKKILEEKYIECSFDELVESVYQCDVEVIKLLIAAGIDINGNDQFQKINRALESVLPSTLYARKDRIEILELLLFHGWKPHEDLISAAVESKDVEILRLLLDHMENIDCGYPLIKAVIDKDNEIVKLLLEHGANTEYVLEGDDNKTALYQAVLGKQPVIVGLLLKHGASPDAHSAHDNLLMKAIYANDMQFAKLLIKHGANINARMPGNGESALTVAVEDYNENFVKLLLDNGADVGDENDRGTALYSCRYCNNETHKRIKKILLSHRKL